MSGFAIAFAILGMMVAAPLGFGFSAVCFAVAAVLGAIAWSRRGRPRRGARRTGPADDGLSARWQNHHLRRIASMDFGTDSSGSSGSSGGSDSSGGGCGGGGGGGGN